MPITKSGDSRAVRGESRAEWGAIGAESAFYGIELIKPLFRNTIFHYFQLTIPCLISHCSRVNGSYAES